MKSYSTTYLVLLKLFMILVLFENIIKLKIFFDVRKHIYFWNQISIFQTSISCAWLTKHKTQNNWFIFIKKFPIQHLTIFLLPQNCGNSIKQFSNFSYDATKQLICFEYFCLYQYEKIKENLQMTKFSFSLSIIFYVCIL